MKQLFIDVETQGLDPKQNGIWQIAGIFCNNGRWEDDFEFHCMPPYYMEWHPKAWEIVDPHFKQRIERKELPENHSTFLDFVHRCIDYVKDKPLNHKIQFCGWNAHFDRNFVKAWFEMYHDESFERIFDRPPLDVKQLALRAIGRDKQYMPSFHLVDVCKWLKIPCEDEGFHGAYYDIEKTKQLYDLLVDAPSQLPRQTGAIVI